MPPPRRHATVDSGHPPVALWIRRVMAVVGIVVVLLTVGTVGVQSTRAEQARQQTDYARQLVEWEDCRINAITQSSVTDDLIGAILAANKRIENAPTYAESKAPRRDLDARLADIQAKRAAALVDQAGCGTRPEVPR